MFVAASTAHEAIESLSKAFSLLLDCSIDPYIENDISAAMGELEDRIIHINSEYPKIMAHINMQDDLMTRVLASNNLYRFKVSNYTDIARWCAINTIGAASVLLHDDIGTVVLNKISATKFKLRWNDNILWGCDD